MHSRSIELHLDLRAFTQRVLGTVIRDRPYILLDWYVLSINPKGPRYRYQGYIVAPHIETLHSTRLVLRTLWENLGFSVGLGCSVFQ